MAEMTMSNFLRHSGSAGGKKEYLSRWKESKEAAVTVWLHKRAGITSIWRHPFPSIEVREDRQTGEKHTEIWSKRAGCWESEDVLQQQNRFDGGIRLVPPEVCGHCRFLEWVRGQVEDGKMPLDFPLFHFEATGGRDRELTLFSAGLYDGYRRVSDAEKDRLKVAGVKLFEAFKLDVRSKLEYVFIVVDDDDPKKGVQIAVEGSLLGQKVQSAVRKRMKDLGDEEGNPLLHPYAIRWEYFKDEREIQKKYDATVMSSVRLTPAVAKLLDEAPPDISALTAKMNPQILLARMQRHIHKDWLKKVPWDDLFGPNLEAFKRHEEKAQESPAKMSSRGAPEVGRDAFYEGVVPAKAVEGKVVRTDPAAKPSTPVADALAKAGYAGPNWSAPKEDDEGAVACDGCERGILVDWPVCPYCGMAYEVAPPEPPPPPPKKFPPRSSAPIAPGYQRSRSAPEPEVHREYPRRDVSPPPAPEKVDDGFGDNDDGLPF